jgi:hypothetical protein
MEITLSEVGVVEIKLNGKFPENNKRYICISNPNMAI